MRTFKTFLSIVVIGGIIDFIALFTVTGAIFQRELSGLLRMSGDAVSPRWWAVVCIYLVMSGLIVFFALPKVNEKKVLSSALGWGALFGLCVYGVYEFTNYSLLRDWTLTTVIVDLIWGTFFGAVLTYIAYHVSKFFSRG